MQKQEPVYIHLPPPLVYVQLPPDVEQLISLIQENHDSQVAIYQHQQDLTIDMKQLSNALERAVNDRHHQLHGIHARLDHLTDALQAQASRAENADSSGPASPSPPVTFPMPEPPFMLPPPGHPVIPAMDFDVPPVIPTPLPVQRPHRNRLRRRC